MGINLEEKLATGAEAWRPAPVAVLNGYDVRLAKLQGGFVWPAHPETEEPFLVVSGPCGEYRDGGWRADGRRSA